MVSRNHLTIKNLCNGVALQKVAATRTDTGTQVSLPGMKERAVRSSPIRIFFAHFLRQIEMATLCHKFAYVSIILGDSEKFIIRE